jgi:hydrogenase/urease accessory protein HupE
MTSSQPNVASLDRETRLSVAIVAVFIPTYATILYLQAGLLVVGIVAGSMVAGFAIWLRTTLRRPPAAAAILPADLLALAAAGFFGFFHGYVHGTEMPAAASPALYAVGFAVSTAGLHVLGALTGLLVLCRERGSIRLRGAGLVVALAGVYFIVAGLRRPLPPAKHALTVSAQR